MVEDVIKTAIAAYENIFPNEASAIERLKAHFEDENTAILVRSNMRGHITTSMAVLSNDWKSILLIKHRAYGLWLQPGGHFEDGNSLIHSAIRELKEETGVEDITLLSVVPIDIDTHPIASRPEKNEGDHFHYDFTYLAVANGEVELVGQEEEVDDVQWVPIAELKDRGGHLGRIIQKVESFYGTD